MRAILRALVVIAVALGGTVALAAGAADPAIGTWTLNLAKSKFSSASPKSETRTYSQDADGLTVTVNGVGPDGSPTSSHYTYKYDGKDYPTTGTSGFDTLSVRRVNAHTVRFTAKKAGKVVATGTRTISADGKVLKLTSKGTDATGGTTTSVEIFDKQ